MEERIISGKKNGMLMLILTILLLLAGVVLVIFGIAVNPVLIALGVLIGQKKCALLVKKAGSLLDNKAIDRNVIDGKRNDLRKSFSKALLSLLGYAVHKVDADVIKANLFRIPKSLYKFIVGMNSAKLFQLVFVN